MTAHSIVAVERQFGSDWGYTGHVADIVDAPQMTPSRVRQEAGKSISCQSWNAAHSGRPAATMSSISGI
jgi:hypothetical protein